MKSTPKTSRRKAARPSRNGKASAKVVRLSEIRPSPENDKLYRPIDTADPEIIALAKSIRQHGVLEPIIVTADGFIVSGHRRYAAAKLANLDVVPVRRLSIRRVDVFPGAQRPAGTAPWEIYYYLKKVLKKAGLPYDSRSLFHRLRRTHATHLFVAGGDPTSSLGHTSEQMTRDYYLDARLTVTEHPSDLLNGGPLSRLARKVKKAIGRL